MKGRNSEPAEGMACPAAHREHSGPAQIVKHLTCLASRSRRLRCLLEINDTFLARAFGLAAGVQWVEVDGG